MDERTLTTQQRKRQTVKNPDKKINNRRDMNDSKFLLFFSFLMRCITALRINVECTKPVIENDKNKVGLFFPIYFIYLKSPLRVRSQRI